MQYKVDLVQNKVYFPFELGRFTCMFLTSYNTVGQGKSCKVTEECELIKLAGTKKVRQFDFLYHNWSRKSDFMN